MTTGFGATKHPRLFISRIHRPNTLGKVLQDHKRTWWAKQIRTNRNEAILNSDLPPAAFPEIAAGHTDRNRTSPFAFTGNKFEFPRRGALRANCANAMTCSIPLWPETFAQFSAKTWTPLSIRVKRREIGHQCT